MKKYLVYALPIVLAIFTYACGGKAGNKLTYDKPEAPVEGFFKAVSDQKFDVAWKSLSKHTQDRFIEEVAKEESIDKEKIRAMFDKNELPIQNGFWKAFRDTSKTEEMVKGASFSVQSSSGNEGLINFNTSNGAVIPCKVFKEGDSWRFGYAETFNI